MKYEATEIKAWTISYIIRGNIIVKGKTIKERVQGNCVTLEKNAREHLELGVNVIADEQRVAEKIEHLSQKLISVSTEVISLKDKGVEKDDLFRKMGKEFRPVFLSLKMILDEHTAEHLAELSSVESKVQEKQIFNIKFIIIFGSLATLLALLIGLFVDRLFMRYVSQQKQAEVQLRESEQKYRTILESIEEGYFEVDIAGNFTFFNNSLGKILGYTN
ncbi:PAS domain-containing protein, partial [bacterium]|nr:PAS domain-containing protein [bacterium]